ncbi:MAG: ATP-binding cassette domain-containing protein, partial [Rhodospirillaceae bacterium]|nr:ATP-binding cassette domain-containing protein [Rhodospirillaceae bacterium]
MSGGALLEVGGLAGGYGRLQVLHGVDLAVPAGRITALVGGNGAGKTTTMAMLAGLLAPSAGTIRYRGEAVGDWSAAQRVAAGLVLVPEGRLVFPDMTVEENLRLGAINRQARPHAA